MLERLYKSLYRIRLLEEELARVYPTDKIKSPVHLSIGQEAVSVGVCEALRPEDVVFGTYRGHALYLAKGGDMKAMVAELYGKATGCTGGKGGSMHLISTEAGMMGTSAVVGTTIANAVGYAYALQLQGQESIVASFFGDGATEEGVFAESLNFAALKRLPILFVCENNGYAIHTSQERRQGRPDICARARAYGIPAERIEHNDVLYLLERTRTEAARIRAGSGPYFFEVMTYRWREHVGPNQDFHLGYRTEDEATAWIEADQVTRLESMLAPERREQIEEEVEAEVEAALPSPRKASNRSRRNCIPTSIKRTISMPQSVSTAVLQRRVGETFQSDSPGRQAGKLDLQAGSARMLSYVDAIREATDQEMARDPSVLVFGLDVDDPKAIQGTTRGLLEKYGLERVFGTPLSEDAMTGAAIGMALAGLRPIHVHIRMDFLMLAMNQLVNVAAKSRYMYGGQVSVPLVVRSMIGKSWGQGAQHSQGLYSFFMHVPGLKVVAPTTPYDAKGCLIAAIRDDNPVLYVEHRILHFQNGPVPTETYTVAPARRASLRGVGRDAGRHLLDAERMSAGQALPRRRRHPGRGDRSDLAQPARHRHHRCNRWRRRAGCSSSTTAGSAAAPRRDRRAGGGAVAGPRRVSHAADGLRPRHLPDDSKLGATLLPQWPHHRGRGARSGGRNQNRLAAGERPELHSIEFKGPF